MFSFFFFLFFRFITNFYLLSLSKVSQADASERLAKSGYQVVGWYHSHPTFVPNPSLRDLETQAKYQELFAEGNKPFLALILNPYCTTSQSSKTTSHISKYKCLMLSDQLNSQVHLPFFNYTQLIGFKIIDNTYIFFFASTGRSQDTICIHSYFG